MLAQQKQDSIKEAFKNWIWKDYDRRDKLTKKYNELLIQQDQENIMVII